jgi:hypothetical protein
MKLVKIILTLIIVHVCLETSAQTEKREQLIPLAIGNYWIYSTSSKSQPLDTLIIIGTRIINGDTAFEFNNGELMLDRNDSVYNYQSERIGIPFKCFLYFPFDKRTEYVIVVGGDVLNRRTASKIKGSYKLNGKEYSNCYQFEDSWESEITTICRGVGILKFERKGYVRTLVEYKLAE